MLSYAAAAEAERHRAQHAVHTESIGGRLPALAADEIPVHPADDTGTYIRCCICAGLTPMTAWLTPFLAGGQIYVFIEHTQMS